MSNIPNRSDMNFRRGRRRWHQRGAAAALGLTALVSALAMAPRASNAARREVLFQQFSSCPRFIAYVRGLTLPEVGPYGLNGNYGVPRPIALPTDARKKTTRATPAATAAPSAARAGASETAAASAAAPPNQPAPSLAPATPVANDALSGTANSSSTNTQEAGVDEGDLIENDGRYLYTGAGGNVRIVDTTDAKLVATIPGDPGPEPQLLLDGPRLAIVRQLFTQWPETVVERWDVSAPMSPRFVSRVHFEGTLLAARTVNHRARIVLQTPFGARLPFVFPTDESAKALDRARQANRSIVLKAKADDWLPRAYNSDEGRNASPVRQAVNCVEIGKPADTSGLGLTWVATLDLNTPQPRLGASGSGGVVGSGNIVYASDRSLYVATTTQTNASFPVGAQPVVAPGGFGTPTRPIVPNRPGQTRTLLHGFDLSGSDGATYFASGAVDGRLLNQFSLSEYGGVLRAAVTTDGAGFGSAQQSGVRVLARNGRSLDIIGSLNGLGITEKIYAVRFLGDLGYIVTFRQVDPLYVVDLRDPRAPRRAGELKIPGYSSYLHPIGAGQLLGVGQDATDQGQRLGTALQVFDVSDPNNPRLVVKLRVGGQSEAEYDHRAFLWWGPTRNAVIPQSTVDRGQYVSGALVTKVNPDAIVVQGRVTHEIPQPGAAPGAIATTIPGRAPAILPGDTPPPYVPTEQIRRSAIVNGRLVTVSPNAVKVTDLATISPLLYAPFFNQ